MIAGIIQAMTQSPAPVIATIGGLDVPLCLLDPPLPRVVLLLAPVAISLLAQIPLMILSSHPKIPERAKDTWGTAYGLLVMLPAGVICLWSLCLAVAPHGQVLPVVVASLGVLCAMTGLILLGLAVIGLPPDPTMQNAILAAPMVAGALLVSYAWTLSG